MYENLVIMIFLMIFSLATLFLKQKLVPLVISLVFLLVGIIMFYPDTTLPYYPWILVIFGIAEIVVFLIAVFEVS